MQELDNICFIIALKYYRNHQTYIKYYVDNIQKFYKNSQVLIIDNNSKYIADIIAIFKDYNNVIIINNNTICKFEIGAYKVGINYLITNNLIDKYEYYIFSQDTFILKNKYDFNNLKNKNTLACAFNSWAKSHIFRHEYMTQICQSVLKSLNLQNSINKLSLCWCSSFILHKSKIIDFIDIIKNLVITIRSESCSSERFLSAILYTLNNNKIEDIDGDIDDLIKYYDCHKVNIINENIHRFFVKRAQQKNENTQDI
jgi:hypothetical protein